MIEIDSPMQVAAGIDNSVNGDSSQRFCALAVAGLIILCTAGWLALEIPRGTLANSDELFTAERTREMLMTGPWVVHFNFQRSFEKPPLQYWLSALTLPRFENRTLAVRIWPLVYGVLTAITFAWLAFLVDPARPWLMPLSVAILASCPRFSVDSSQALLDMGLTFYTTVAIICAQLARNRPVWWLGVAIAGWLASLQKIPLVFLVWLMIIAVRLGSVPERRTLRSPWLVCSFILGLGLSAIWPVIQTVKYGMSPLAVFHEEVIVWLGPEHLGTQPYLEVPFKLTTIAWVGGGLCSLVALLIVSFTNKKRFSTIAREISAICLMLIALAILFNFRKLRYIIPIIPCLCLLLAVVLQRFIEQGGAVRRRAVLLLTLILFAGVVQAKIEMHFRCKDLADEKRVAEELGASQSKDMRIVLIKAKEDKSDLYFDSFYLFHGNLRFPVARYTVDEVRRARPEPPVLGVCVARDLPVVQEAYPNVQVQFSRAKFVLWRVNEQ